MAIYEFRCLSCGNEFEVSRPMRDAALPANCPACKAEGERLISGFASKAGFYVRAPRKPFRETPDQ